MKVLYMKIMNQLNVHHFSTLKKGIKVGVLLLNTRVKQDSNNNKNNWYFIDPLWEMSNVNKSGLWPWVMAMTVMKFI